MFGRDGEVIWSVSLRMVELERMGLVSRIGREHRINSNNLISPQTFGQPVMEPPAATTAAPVDPVPSIEPAWPVGQFGLFDQRSN
jgi:hypothetical protein